MTRVVARWRYGAYRVVGLEFHASSRLDPARLAPHLAQLKHLEFIKMPHASVEEWSERLPDKYAVVHCPSQGDESPRTIPPLRVPPLVENLIVR